MGLSRFAAMKRASQISRRDDGVPCLGSARVGEVQVGKVAEKART
jgi:hypothetical protein